MKGDRYEFDWETRGIVNVIHIKKLDCERAVKRQGWVLVLFLIIPFLFFKDI